MTSVQLNHTIVWCTDKARSAQFLRQLLDLPVPTSFGPFLVLEFANRVSLDFSDDGERPVAPQHYAFLVSQDTFDATFARLRDAGLDWWADPGRTRRGETYRHNGGQGLYFVDPDGHLMEIMTRPYVGD